jgi:TonB-linked SusC/RagA family outer membrane protein
MKKNRSQGLKAVLDHAGRICLLLVLLSANMDGYGQDSNKRLTVQFKNVSLIQALQEIEKQSGLNFSYSENNLRSYGKPITFNLKEATLKQVLDKIFTGSVLIWSLKGDLILLSANPAREKTEAKPLTSADVLSGSVTDAETGDPLQGVTVKIGNHTVLTGEDGRYSLALPAGTYPVVLTHVGYITEQIPGVTVTGESPFFLHINLKKADAKLNEVVVVGYGKQSRRLLTSSISTVRQEDFNRGSFSNPAQLLQGKVAGLSIERSGDPNAPPSIILRGPSTLRTGEAQEPFYVIDGVPGADYRLIAPDDIATIDVLKDASATAIYGTRAANGVIIITTKRGKPDQTEVSLNNYVGVETVARKIKMMDAVQLNGYLTKNGLSLDPSDSKGANTDWQKEVSRTAFSQNQNLSFSGSSKNTSYSAGVNYFDNQGILKGSDMNRLTGRINIEQKALNDHLHLGLSVSNSTSNSDIIPNQPIVLYNMLRYLPTVPVKQADGSFTENLQRVQYYNPVSLLENATQQLKSKITMINATVQVLLPWGFKYDLSVSSQNIQDNQGIYYKSTYTLTPGLNGEAYRSSYESTNKIAETFLTFDKKIAASSINVLAGYSWQETVTGDGFQANNINFATDDPGYMNIGLGSPAGNFRTDWGSTPYEKLRLISFYARGKYNFADKYLVQASLRRDGSSAFGVNHRWALFPAGSVAWRVSEESFMKSQNLFNDLKVRAGYGITGNSLGFDPLISKVRYGSTGTFYYNGSFVNGIGPTQNDNPDLKWEKTAMLNLGVDMSFFKNRLSATVEYYNKKTTDLIWSYPVSTTQYFVNTYWANAGAISNKGFEIAIDAIPVQTSAFRWTTSFNIAHNDNKLLSLSNGQFKQDSLFQMPPGGQGETGTTVQILKSGHPVGQFFTFRYAGKNSAGISQYYDKNGKLTTTPANFTDFYYAGNAQPKLLIGWNNNFSYKNFDLNIFLRSAIGAKIMNATLADLDRPNDVRSYNLPAWSAQESPADANAYKYSDRFVENGSYLRIDNVTLGYTFFHVLKGLRSLRLYASGNNLAIITGYRGIDPELAQGGLTPGVDNKNYYPRTRAFLFGLNAAF